MGQIFSWFRGSNPREEPGLRDVSVEESQSGTTPKPAAPVSHYEQKPSARSNMASKPTAAGSDVTATGSAAKTDPGAPDVTLFSPKGWSKSGASAQAKTSTTCKVQAPTKTTTASTSVKAEPAKTTKPTTTTTTATATSTTTKPTSTTTAPTSTTTKPTSTTTAPTSTTTKPTSTTTAPTGTTTKPTSTTTAPTSTTAKPTTTTATPTSTTTTTTTTTTASKTPTTKAEKTKVQVEVPPKTKETKQVSPPLDPLDALASSLPSEAPKCPEPKYTGPEVKEGKVTSEEGVRVGEREDTLPPGYRLQDMAPVPADAKPAEVPKPLSTDDALDLLSEGFLSESAPKVETIGAASTAQTNFAAAPQPPKKSEPAVPPADKKAKLDSDSFSLSTAVPATKPSAAAPKTSKPQTSTVKTPSMDADALGALEDLLPSAEPPKPEAPLRPDQIVKEATVEEEEGVRVGEREDTLPPEYRRRPEDKDLPPPQPEPSLSTPDALDFLSGDFSSSSAPTTQSAAPAPAQKPVSAPVDKKPRMETDEFSLEAGLTPSSVQKVQSAAVPPPKKSETKPTKSEGKPKNVTDSRPALEKEESMSLDALGALEDLLPSAEPPKPEAPLRPDQIVKEATVEEEEGVRVGEREDTLPPEYRRRPEDKDLPPPQPEPSLSTPDALDFLSGDFSSSSAKTTQSAAPAPAQADADDALDLLSGDFLAPSAAPTVQSSFCPPQASMEAGADSALDALSDSLKDIAPIPQPEPPMPTNIVKERKIEEERLIKMGERDDTLPPEFRLTEEERKKMEEEKNKVPESPRESMDDATALDLLAGDFSSTPAPAVPSAPAAPSAPVSSSASAPVCSAPKEANKPMSGKTLESLSDTLVSDLKKTEKPKKSQAEGAVDLLSSQLSSDVVPTTTKKS